MFGENIPYKQIPPEDNPSVLRGYWDTAKGLQKVDGLETTALVEEIAESTIQGSISVEDAPRIIRKHYGTIPNPEVEAHEADMATANIVRLLSHSGFMPSAAALQTIHREIFTDIPLHGNPGVTWAGVFRTDDRRKDETILNGRSVHYSSHVYITDQLRAAFEDESDYIYGFPFTSEGVSHIAKFIATIWQVHPFWEGNTRTAAVFLIQYLRSMGFDVHNDPFKEHSLYFRNALVRASFFDIKRGIQRDTSFLEFFLETLLFDAHHDFNTIDTVCHELFED